ncbi:MAG: cell division protein FtsZ [Nitrospirae bacterium]|nr:cell division protein FtsZ [Nitrospirota bacterium]
MFEIEEIRGQNAKIKVVGVGGAGGNAINNMIASNMHGVEFIAVNTALQVLETSLAPVKVQIGRQLTKGLGAGSNPEIGRQAALEDRATIMDALDGCDMVFITAGMGGGTGTGAAPVIASIAREIGALTVAIITKPFFYEGKRRKENAEEGVRDLSNCVDTMIVIPNDKITLVVDKGTPMIKAFSIANDVLRQAVQGISDIILVPGLINVDFADVKTVMESMGRAVMGAGSAAGQGSAFEAAKKAISNPLLEHSSIEGAKGILINITGGLELSIDDIQAAASYIHDNAHEDAVVIFGAVIDPDMNDEVRVTVIATGFEERREKVELPEIKKWTPVKEVRDAKAAAQTTEAKEDYLQPAALRASERVLAKSLNYAIEPAVPGDMFSYDEETDLPAFLRRSSHLMQQQKGL